ncbi:MAG TPA: methyltransferase [Verrucomicrobiae bacterium]|nr:methyltransferase [Verrucomicrobiae bacterium]
MNPAVSRSPWWYRHRAAVMTLIYLASFYLSYGVASLANLSTVPVLLCFGPKASREMFALALVLAGAGWLLRAWGTSYLDARVVWNRDALADRLYVAGPFRFTRNPLYLGNLLLAAALALFAPPLGWPIVMIGQLLFIGALIKEEEGGLRARYGSEFERYRTAVPRLLPRLSPAPAEQAPHGSFAGALYSESLMAGFVATFALYLVFGLRAGDYPWLCALAGLLLQYVTRRRPL